jgi:hypothetical protein
MFKKQHLALAIAATLAAGAAQAALETSVVLKNETARFLKDGKQIKVIDRDWVKLGGSDDPRAIGWGYWYGKTLETGHETWAVIPSKVNAVNADYDKNWWSEGTLRKIKR